MFIVYSQSAACNGPQSDAEVVGGCSEKVFVCRIELDRLDASVAPHQRRRANTSSYVT